MPATFCRYRLWLGILYEIYSAIGHVSHFKTKEKNWKDFRNMATSNLLGTPKNGSRDHVFLNYLK